MPILSLERALVLTFSVLATLLFGEWRAGCFSVAAGQTVPSMEAGASPVAIVQPPVDSDAQVAEALARPLFDPRRQTATAAVAPDGGATLHVRLAGTVVTGTDAEALFVGVPPVPARAVRVGDMVDGWMVEEIAADSVVLRAGELRVAMQPAADGKFIATPYKKSALMASLLAPRSAALRLRMTRWGRGRH